MRLTARCHQPLQWCVDYSGRQYKAQQGLESAM